ncbi:hypothetical protein U9M48_036731 [Paspalum notatum var. saurae]|uniref:Uncharacterized protein n=1 Tax=Paspalum notatum var. saurae TaxID=547442 RepID=A0AAQ3UJR6_PASNO
MEMPALSFRHGRSSSQRWRAGFLRSLCLRSHRQGTRGPKGQKRTKGISSIRAPSCTYALPVAAHNQPQYWRQCFHG